MPLARRVRPRLGTAGLVAGGPADDEGLSLQYASGGLVAGLDARRVFGRSQEALHPAPLSAAAVSRFRCSIGGRGGRYVTIQRSTEISVPLEAACLVPSGLIASVCTASVSPVNVCAVPYLVVAA